MKKKIAIIGSGGSGLSIAWFLSESGQYDVTIIEKSKLTLGGHSNTYILDDIPVDPGFYAFSDEHYPKFIYLLNKLKVQIEKFDSSVSYHNTKDPDGSYMFLPPISKLQYFEIRYFITFIRARYFFRIARRIVKNNDKKTTMEDIFKQNPYLDDGQFKTQYLYPIMSAPWGVTVERFGEIIVYDVAKWYIDHKLDTFFPVKWSRVKNGVGEYIEKMIIFLESKKVHFKFFKVSEIKKLSDGKLIINNNSEMCFDSVVLATQGIDAVEIVKYFRKQKAIIENIVYEPTTRIVARYEDNINVDIIPKEISKWCNYNIIYDDNKKIIIDTMHYGGKSLGITNLDDFYEKHNVRPIAVYKYDHVVPNKKTHEARNIINKIQGKDRLYFSGGYLFGDSFHEAVIEYSLIIAKQIMANDNVIIPKEINKVDKIKVKNGNFLTNFILEFFELQLDLISYFFLQFLRIFNFFMRVIN
jgi:predicted NAD/FAD-binding protein